ncbi:MAG: hypothetical protein GC161_15980 [Planctomycetaceae bacterium]|nr:hypothetical protein [Planctomycetaceae bacterium]
MTEAAILLLENAIEVSAHRAAPIGTARDYLLASVELAMSHARPGETATEALARLIVSGSSIVHLLYEAAEKSHAVHNQP